MLSELIDMIFLQCGQNLIKLKTIKSKQTLYYI